MIDIHSHILPGIDDGSRDYEESIEMIRCLADAGATDIIFTPHYVPDSKWTSTRYKNQRLLTNVRARLEREKIKVNIYLGNENYINTEILDLLASKTISPLADSKYVLIELPMSGEWDGYEDVLLMVKQAGYKPILAHPERYQAFQKDYSLITELCNMGILMQCNFGSIIGQYGRKARKTIKKMAKDDLIFCLGSDIHRPRAAADLIKAQAKLGRYYDEAGLKQILEKNPRKILR